jgi:hypothetical protein
MVCTCQFCTRVGEGMTTRQRTPSILSLPERQGREHDFAVDYRRAGKTMAPCLRCLSRTSKIRNAADGLGVAKTRHHDDGAAAGNAD